MSLIYEPKGKAREYSPLALNVYSGCDHGCKYCYVPDASRGSCSNELVKIRPRYLEQLRAELTKSVPTEQVLLSFLTDPYNTQEPIHHYTRQTLLLLAEFGAVVSVLTKGAARAMADIDCFRRFGPHIQVGCTLTFMDEAKSLATEPKASTPEQRIALLAACHQSGVRTWCSIEPVLEPAESLAIMKAVLPYVDLVKIGKLNHDPVRESQINWRLFLTNAVSLVRAHGKDFYIKDDLAAFAAPSLGLRPENRNADHWALRAPRPGNASCQPSGDLFA